MSRFSENDLRRAGVTPTPRPGRRSKAKAQKPDPSLFIAACAAWGIPEPVPEHHFAAHEGREWRFDFCWPLWRVALEVQGGIFTQGRHTRGAALLQEHEKLNAAAVLGWRILYCTPAEVQSGAIFPTIKRAMGL